MKKGFKRITAFCMTLLVMMSFSFVVVSAETDIMSVDMTVQYGQTEARSILSMVNTLRTGSDAWYWDSDDTTKITCSGLGTLTYDYELEQVAMQRAAEIAMTFEHTRPDGEQCFTAYTSTYDNTYRAENIAAGYASAAAVFAGWEEEDGNYAGQGHRRNMLNSNMKAIGIGHVYYNGTHYWVQEFSSKIGSATQTTAQDGETVVGIDVDLSKLTSVSLTASKTSMQVEQGTSTALPGLTASIVMDGTWPANSKRTVSTQYTWKVEDATVASVSGGMLTGKKAGTTTLTAGALGQSVTVKVTVTAAADGTGSVGDETGDAGTDGDALTQPVVCNHVWNQGVVTKQASSTEAGTRVYTCIKCGETKTETIAAASAIKLSKTTYTYNGKKRTPSVQILDTAGKVIDASNYTVKYATGRKKVGVYSVTVEFSGAYSGKMTASFTIRPKRTSITKLKAAKKSFTIQWKKKTVQVDGYQIQYSTKKTLKKVNSVSVGKKATVSKTIKKLKAKKKYYVRVRTYKIVKVNGKSKKIYSAWSKIKSIQTK